MGNRADSIDPKGERFNSSLTILSTDVRGPDDLGFVCASEGITKQSSSLFMGASSSSSRQGLKEPAQESKGDVAMEDKALSTSEGEALIPTSQEALSPPVGGAGVVSFSDPASVTIKGVVLTVESSASLLKAGCKACGLSTPGSRTKLYKRLRNHVLQQQLERQSLKQKL